MQAAYNSGSAAPAANQSPKGDSPRAPALPGPTSSTFKLCYRRAS